MGFRIWDFGFGVWGSGFGVWGIIVDKEFLHHPICFMPLELQCYGIKWCKKSCIHRIMGCLPGMILEVDAPLAPVSSELVLMHQRNFETEAYTWGPEHSTF